MDRSASNRLDSLEQAACRLSHANSLDVSISRKPDILHKLDEVDGWLSDVLLACQKHPARATVAANWLLDNDYRIRRALISVAQDLPDGFHRQLPRLASPQYDGLPRAYLLVYSLLEHSEMQVTEDRLQKFLLAYQRSNALVEAELWAIPTLLRLACIENLISGVDRLFEASAPVVATNTIVQDHVCADSTTAVSGAIATLVVVSEINWADFIDQVSMVEARLQHDPGEIYPTMSQSSRIAYRQDIEKLSRRCKLSEIQIAEKLISMGQASEDQSCLHVGYWLVGPGRQQFHNVVNYRVPFAEKLRQFSDRHSTMLYALMTATVGLVLLSGPAFYLLIIDASLWQMIGIMLLSLVPAADIAVQFVHWFVPRFISIRKLYSLGRHTLKDADFKCALIVPVIVNQVDEVYPLIEKLELRYLANTENYLQFVLLSDPGDADQERVAEDAAIESALVKGIRGLNERYPSSVLDGQSDDKPKQRFLLLHRSRSWNAGEGHWIAWERKRGKIEQFNELLTSGNKAPFTLIEGHPDELKGVKYVISLDADTMLPPGSAAELVATFEHPLNQPVVDEQTGKVVAGYTILQPRIETLETREAPSYFAKIYSGDCAIDIYSNVVSNFYQDWFGEGSYFGKGIYHVASFHSVLAGRVPENRILSHDLFEGLHGRVAAATHITFYESFPETWSEHCERRHRWIRGDWQLLSWLGRSVPSGGGTQINSTFSIVDRWKLLDNLRRSITAPVLLIYLFCAWTLFPGSTLLWTILATMAFAPYLVNEALTGLSLVSRNVPIKGYLHEIKINLARWAVSIALIVPDSIICIDAIAVTLWRRYVSGRHMLQWRSAAHSSGMPLLQVREFHRAQLVWLSPIAALISVVVLSRHDPLVLAYASPVLLSWLFAPILVLWLSKPRVFRRDSLMPDDQQYLRRVARQTWYYFERFAGPDDNWLPPDNFQAHESVGIAHRTSTTNMGLYLTSTLGAHDLGFIGSMELAVRTENLLGTIDLLETHRNQLLNWYDTRTLEPLEPRYVSTVDNGNLAISLIAARHGCLDAVCAPLLSTTRWTGLVDTFTVLLKMLEEQGSPLSEEVHHELVGIVERFQAIADNHGDLGPMAYRFKVFPGWSLLASNLGLELSAADEDIQFIGRIMSWIERCDHQISTLFRDAHYLLPWLGMVEDTPLACQGVADLIDEQLVNGYPLSNHRDAHAKLQSSIAMARSKAGSDPESHRWLDTLEQSLKQGFARQAELLSRLNRCAVGVKSLAWKMDFSWLFDWRSRLFHIGYNVSSATLDTNHYDLLASECRMASYFAIAKHDVPLRHWFELGRPITRHAGLPVLRSWSGSMFEYLMPTLFLPGKSDTLIGESESLAVLAQQQYASTLGIPWGVSESAFSVCDAENNFQYKAFGSPALGIRRGLGEDRVVAPYSSLLALGVWPKAAVDNLRRLHAMGALGEFGFVDALDFTPGRLMHSEEFRLVDTWMAHHQGMSMAAIVNVLKRDLMSRRVLKEPSLHAIELLLQERIPWSAPVLTEREADPEVLVHSPLVLERTSSWKPIQNEGMTNIQMLGNGRFASHVSQKGGGGLHFNDLALTRTSGDRSKAHLGYRIHVNDDKNCADWWIGSCACAVADADTSTVFSQHDVEFIEHMPGLTVRTDIIVATSEDMEVRRITLVNEESVERTLTLTSYAEIVLSPVGDDNRHPAFNKLFINSKAEPELAGVCFMRQPREPGKRFPLLLHRLVSDDPQIEFIGFETDRHQWYGQYRNPLLVDRKVPHKLSNTSGWTLDPIMSLRACVTLGVGEKRTVYFVTSVADTRSDLREQALHFQVPGLERLFVDAPRITAQAISQLGIDDTVLPDMQRLASLLYYPHPAMRSVLPLPDGCLPRQAELWRVGISGDLPLLLLRVHDVSDTAVLETLVKAQSLWRSRSFSLDIGVFQVSDAGYEDPLRELVMALLRDTLNTGWLGRRGGIHLLSMGQLSLVSQQSILASAVVVIDTDRDLHERLNDVLDTAVAPPPLGVTGTIELPADTQLERPTGLLFDNGLGGFDPHSSEYVLHLHSGVSTPAPWCNILANESVGCIVSEAGLGSTWSRNSGEHRLSEWVNDPVLNPQAEQLWVRDEATGEAWTICPQPGQQTSTVQVRHGFGYTSWTRNSFALEQQQTVFVPVDDPVKVICVSLLNRSATARRVTLTLYVDWVLEAMSDNARTHAVCAYDAQVQAILARNAWNSEFAEGIAFVSATEIPHSVCGDRSQFIGSADQFGVPDGLLRSDLGGRFTPGSDCCAAYQVHLDIPVDAKLQVAFTVGEGSDEAQARELIERWRSTAYVNKARGDVQQYWDELLSAVEVYTPDPGFDLMINRWLQYQSVSSRLHARAGFYQAGGAYGFRDQLQDVLACIGSDSKRVRRQLLLCAEHQFEQGDVLHWWHPPGGRGIRTRISDDFLWMVYVCARYVEATGDLSILDVDVPYLQATQLKGDEHDRYSVFDHGSSGSFFDHCCRALDNGMRTGAHGLPLIGSGDWNDGMDRIGHRGFGESIWLAWFQIVTIARMTPIAIERGEYSLASRWHAHATALKQAIDDSAWDGQWFLRAFDDEGQAWGSNENDECRIDLLAQSWGVLAGFGEEARVVTAMQAAAKKLVDRDNDIVKLLTPAFQHTPRNPGYIKAYPPGIRENGGQYTHAATWLGLAYAAMGDADNAYDIFRIINPINRTGNPQAVNRYAREPYVLAADVGGVDPHTGKGGWTWYTGAAGWTWQLGVHGILGIEYLPGAVRLAPCIPSHWEHVEMVLRSGTSSIEISINNTQVETDGGSWISVDGELITDRVVRFPSAGKTRKVELRLGNKLLVHQ